MYYKIKCSEIIWINIPLANLSNSNSKFLCILDLQLLHSLRRNNVARYKLPKNKFLLFNFPRRTIGVDRYFRTILRSEFGIAC